MFRVVYGGHRAVKLSGGQRRTAGDRAGSGPGCLGSDMKSVKCSVGSRVSNPADSYGNGDTRCEMGRSTTNSYHENT